MKIPSFSFCLELRSSPISQGNLVTTLPTWGPSYRITFELYINSFDGANLKNGRLAELLRLTTTDSNCCAIGDRIPAIFTDKGGFIQVTTQIGTQGNKWKNVNLNKKTWYRLDLMQYSWNDKVSFIIIGKFFRFYVTAKLCFQYYFEIKLNGRRMWKVENNNPKTFAQVKFWATEARHGFPPADASIRNLVYENTGTFELLFCALSAQSLNQTNCIHID